MAEGEGFEFRPQYRKTKNKTTNKQKPNQIEGNKPWTKNKVNLGSCINSDEV
jgi:hypothetical protein